MFSPMSVTSQQLNYVAMADATEKIKAFHLSSECSLRCFLALEHLDTLPNDRDWSFTLNN